MNYVVLSIIVIGTSFFYERMNAKLKFSKSVRIFFYVSICFLLCGFAGLRTSYNDTGSYIVGFKNTTNDFSSLFLAEFNLSEVYLFKIWNYIIYNFITKDVNVYLFLCSMVFVCPSVYLIQKYSNNFTFSMLVFIFGGSFLFSLAGLKQTMATGIVLLALPKLINKKYFTFYLSCLVAIGFHVYSIFYLVVPLLGIEVFNKRTVAFCSFIVVFGVLLSYFGGVITAIIEFLGKETSYEMIQEGSVNIVRAVVFAVPLILAMLSANNLKSISDEKKLFIKIGIISSMYMLLALFGNPILFGRVPYYFVVGSVISLPVLIENTFIKKESLLITTVAIVCYIAYGLYALYVDGAFAKDIFKLIWF